MKTIHQPKPAGPPQTPPQFDGAMLAHDLRSALQGVIGGVALLDAAALDARTREQVERVSAAAKNLTRLIGVLLGDDMERQAEDAVTRVDLPRFLRHIARRWSGEAQERGLRLRIDAAPNLPAVVDADRAMLGRALGNLLGNCTAYAGRGEVRLTLRRTGEGGLDIWLQDDGPGIPQDTLDKVLGAGAAAVDVTDAVHGLGLHIVRAFCEEMGATFALGNRPEGGADAHIVFPAYLCGDAQAPSTGAVRVNAADLSGVRVLLAEDNPTNQIVATQMLRALHAEVTLSSDGIEAMEKFELGEFDLIVVDIEMPRMTGLDVIRSIRGRTDGRADVPIVALTAYAMREHRERIAAAGANGLISKPITSVDALGRALRAHVATPRRTGLERFDEAPAALREAPLADLEVFDALCAAIGAGMMEELLGKVVADLMQARSDLEKAIEPLDRKPIRSASHILISVAGAIGATRLQSCARALNAAAQVEDGRELGDDVRRCLGEIDAAVAFADSRRAPA